MKAENQLELNHLITFLNQCPFGLVKADSKGNILMINGFAGQFITPVIIDWEFDRINILDIIGHFNENLRGDIESFDQDYGIICTSRRIKVEYQSTDKVNYLTFSINKLNDHIYQYAFKEVSDIIEAEHQLKEMTEAVALQMGKLEMSSGILHDIGNAATAFGTEVANLTGSLNWRELNDLDKLIKLFENKSESLDQVLGAGKGNALKNFLIALKDSLDKKHERYSHISSKLYDTTSHIQDILNIQRQYAKGITKIDRAPVQFQKIITDALAIQGRNLEKRGIKIIKQIPIDAPKISGDETRLIQVLINILKNSGEAFDKVEDKRNKQLDIVLNILPEKNRVVLMIKDNAIGFEKGTGSRFFEKGMTSKDKGSGFGLFNCKQIIDSHQGKIHMESTGIGKGAITTIEIPYTRN